MPSLTEADDRRTVDVRVGETVEVTLPERGGGGYSWAVDHIDPGIAKAYEPKSHYPKDQVGSAGKKTFGFEATKPGSGEVRLKHWRDFEGDSSINMRFRLRINAKS